MLIFKVLMDVKQEKKEDATLHDYNIAQSEGNVKHISKVNFPAFLVEH